MLFSIVEFTWVKSERDNPWATGYQRFGKIKIFLRVAKHILVWFSFFLNTFENPAWKSCSQKGKWQRIYNFNVAIAKYIRAIYMYRCRLNFAKGSFWYSDVAIKEINPFQYWVHFNARGSSTVDDLNIGNFWQNMDIFQCMQTKALICFYFTLIRSPRPSLSPSPSQTRLWPRKLSSSWKFTACESFQVDFAGNRGKSMMMGSSCKVRSTGHQQKLLFVSKASLWVFSIKRNPTGFPEPVPPTTNSSVST